MLVVVVKLFIEDFLIFVLLMIDNVMMFQFIFVIFFEVVIIVRLFKDGNVVVFEGEWQGSIEVMVVVNEFFLLSVIINKEL